jgi:hypothetical protein
MTAEGYMVLPTSGLGNRYIHCSQQDNDETQLLSEPTTLPNYALRTGFSCIAVVDNTRIYMRLVTNQPYCMTYKGKRDRVAPYVSPVLMTNEI